MNKRNILLNWDRQQQRHHFGKMAQVVPDICPREDDCWNDETDEKDLRKICTRRSPPPEVYTSVLFCVRHIESGCMCKFTLPEGKKTCCK